MINKLIKPLTSLRFIFALMVFAFHLTSVQTISKPLSLVYCNILYEGYIGVSFFFILSGFILAYNYQNLLITKKISKYAFWKARIARIYPMHIFTFILAIPLIIYADKEFFNNGVFYIEHAIPNIFLIQNFIPDYSFNHAFNAPSWAISNEMFFYLMFPLIIFIIGIKGLNSCKCIKKDIFCI